MANKKVLELNNNLKLNYEEIRTNFNKISMNLQKMINSNPDLVVLRENYLKNKGSYSKIPRPRSTIKNEDEGHQNLKLTGKIDEDFIPQQDNLDSIDDKISSLYKNISEAKYKSNIDIPTKSLLNKSSHSNSNKNSKSPLNDEKIKNIKTFHNEKVYFQNIQSFMEELEHVKEFCRNLQKSQQNNCLVTHERKNFENMKSEVIKLSSDVSIIKDELNEITSIFQQINQRINKLEDENNSLKYENNNLMKNIKRSIPGQFRNEKPGMIVEDYAPEKSTRRDFQGSQGFNEAGQYENDYRADKQSYRPLNQTKSNNNIHSQREVDNKFTHTDISGLNSMNNNSSLEMNMNMKVNMIDNNPNETRAKKRFLISK